jgi:DNA-directed RNA polymerase subunit L
MSNVYLDLNELGYSKVKEIEDRANFYKYENSLTEDKTIQNLCREFNIKQDTAIIIAAYSLKHQCSEFVKDESML